VKSDKKTELLGSELRLEDWMVWQWAQTRRPYGWAVSSD